MVNSIMGIGRTT